MPKNTPKFGDPLTKLGDVKSIVHDGLLATAICVGHGHFGELFIQEIDKHTDAEDIEIYDVPADHIFPDTEDGRVAAIALWKGEK